MFAKLVAKLVGTSNLKTIVTNKNYDLGTGRFGHSAVSNQRGEMFVFGGFGKGLMLNSLLKYTPANCSQLKNKIDCCSKVFTDNCVWYNECMEYDQTLLNNHINSALTSSSGGSPKKNSHALSSDNDQNTFCHPNFNVHRPDRLTNGSFLSDHRSKCPMKFHNNEKACKKITSCPNCLENSAQCVSWQFTSVDSPLDCSLQINC